MNPMFIQEHFHIVVGEFSRKKAISVGARRINAPTATQSRRSFFLYSVVARLWISRYRYPCLRCAGSCTTSEVVELAESHSASSLHLTVCRASSLCPARRFLHAIVLRLLPHSPAKCPLNAWVPLCFRIIQLTVYLLDSLSLAGTGRRTVSSCVSLRENIPSYEGD